MSWNITNLLRPLDLDQKYKTQDGFNLISVQMPHSEDNFIPLVSNERIVELASIKQHTDQLSRVNGTAPQGASQLMLGQPAVYGFTWQHRGTFKSYVAIRPILQPFLMNWLKDDQHHDTHESAILQAEEFCRDDIPVIIEEMYAMLEMDILRTHHRRKLN